MKRIILFILLITSSNAFGQVEANEAARSAEAVETFIIKGQVIESDSFDPIPKVNIQVNGGDYTTTDNLGEFRINAKLNDEIIIKHNDFETVYYIVKSGERITVKVLPKSPSDANIGRLKKFEAEQGFNALLDSAESYKRTDANKSLQFVTDALTVSTSTENNAEAYELLGDIFFRWQQFDLAITNFRISLQNNDSNEVQLKLAQAYTNNKNYQEGITTFKAIDKAELSNWQTVILYEGLGDIYVDIKDYAQGINNYQEGLKVAQRHLITPKVTDLNSKIAQALENSGSEEEAEDYYEKSLNLASQQNKKRAAEEKVKVADFRNRVQDYDDEIKNRQDALLDIEDISADSIIDNESSLTAQKQNYKIGNAYYLQKEYSNAIPYLKKSIEEASEKDDLVVEKDATRKLSEVYRDAGDFENAMSAYNKYIDVVDKLYSRKEQEIIQAARFREDLSEKQNRITSLESERALSSTKYELSLERNKRQQLIIYSLIIGVLLLLVAGYFMYKSIRQQKLANNLLALKSLRSQMNPHFIFNALNSVNSFISNNDERTANKYLSDFSLLMRSVLENSEEDFIPLEKEIELLDLYIKLEHFRFQDKFDYELQVEDNVAVSEFQIPPMLLQPYIENAVWHGLRYKKDRGSLKVRISQERNDEICIEITDDGIGRDKSREMKTEHQKKHRSKGLSNIQKRVAILNDMYKDKVDVIIADYKETEDVGTKVRVTLKKD